MVRVGHREVVFSQVILVADEEQAEVTLAVEGSNFRMFLSFHPDTPGTDQKVEAVVEKGALRLRFHRWSNPLGTTFNPAPVNIGTGASGRPIELYLFQNKVGLINRVDLQVTIGDARA